MDKMVEKFNIFDIFTMLIPGIGITSLFCISLSFQYYDLWLKIGNEKYIIFVIFSYFCGVIFQEFGTICDKKFLYNISFKGNPREICFLQKGHETIFNEELFYKEALSIKKFIIAKLHIEENSNLDEKEEKELNAIIYGFCLNLSEVKNISGKAEKMIVLSEMSRSLFWGCFSTIILNIYMVIKYFYSIYRNFYFIEIVFLVFASYIFYKRKKRYERYRIRILFRELYLHINMKE